MIASLLLGSILLAAPADDLKERAKAQAAALVLKLGDPSFRVREKTSGELVQLGGAALEALRKGIKHPDAEISERCQKLVPLALDHHLQEQIEVFLAKPDGPIPADLPGIKRWVKIAGSGKESRELYATFVREQRRFLIDIEQQPDKAAQRFQVFCQDVQQRSVGVVVNARAELVSQSELVLFLFIASDPHLSKYPATSSITYQHANVFLNSTYLSSMLSDDAANVATKNIFLAWLEHERYPTLLRRGFQIAGDAELKEAAPIALRIAADKGALATTRWYALSMSAKLFGPKHFKQLEELMQDQLVIRRTQINGEILTMEMRDVALGVAIQASGQKPNDFGFEHFREHVSHSPKLSSFSSYSLTEKQREEAHKKWKEWRAKQAAK